MGVRHMGEAYSLVVAIVTCCLRGHEFLSKRAEVLGGISLVILRRVVLALVTILVVACDLSQDGKSPAKTSQAPDRAQASPVAGRWELTSDPISKHTFLLDTSTGRLFVLQSTPDGKEIIWTEKTPFNAAWPADVKVLGTAKDTPREKRIEGGVYVLGDGRLGTWHASRGAFTRPKE